MCMPSPSVLCVEWKVWVLFSDERCVPLEHDDSNFKACKTHLFDKARTLLSSEC